LEPLVIAIAYCLLLSFIGLIVELGLLVDLHSLELVAIEQVYPSLLGFFPPQPIPLEVQKIQDLVSDGCCY